MLPTTVVFTALLLAAAAIVVETTAPVASPSKGAFVNFVTAHKPPSGELRCRAGQIWQDECRRCVCESDGTLRCEALPCDNPGKRPLVIDGFVMPPHDFFKARGVHMDHAFHSDKSDSAKVTHVETQGTRGRTDSSESHKGGVDSVTYDEEDGNGNYDDYDNNDADVDVTGRMPEHTLEGLSEDSLYTRSEDHTRHAFIDPPLLTPKHRPKNHISVENKMASTIQSQQNPQPEKCQRLLEQRLGAPTRLALHSQKQSTGYREKPQPSFSEMDKYNTPLLSKRPYQIYLPLQLPDGSFTTRQRPFVPREDLKSPLLQNIYPYILENRGDSLQRRSLHSYDTHRQNHLLPFYSHRLINHRRSIPTQRHSYYIARH